MNKKIYKKDAINLLTSFYFSSFLIVCFSVIVYHTHKFFVPQPSLSHVQALFLEKFSRWVIPKHDENFTFSLTLLLSPFIAYISILFARNFIKNLTLSQIKNLELFLILTTSIILITFFYNSVFFINLTSNIYHNKKIIYSLVICAIIASLVFNQFNVPLRYKKFFSYLLILLCITIIIFQSVSFRIVSVNFVGKIGGWMADFSAAFYSVTQVFAGKTILSQLPAQYGMYGEILNPIFKLIGLNVFNFTLILGILQMAALASILFVQWKLQNSKCIFFLYLLNLILSTGFVWYFIINYIGPWTPYYQYYPIRFFFPAVSILLQYVYMKKMNTKFIPIIGIFSALSILWNIESGIAVFGAFFAYIASYLLFPSSLMNRKKAILCMAYFLGATLCVLSLFILYLNIKSNYSIDLSNFFKYQQIFYQSGFMMVSLPITPNPWQVICGIYLFGMIAALYHWQAKERTFYWDMIFFLSILGFGLFIYYQGCAHPNVLVLVSWPAAFILFSLCGLLFRLMKVNVISKNYVLLGAIVLFFSFATAVEFIAAVPMLYHTTINILHLDLNPIDTEFNRNIDFIKKNAPEKNILIIAPNYAVYYGELGWSSPANGPGSNEIILKSDLEALKSQVLKQKYFFYQPTDIVSIRDDLGNVLDQFYVAKKSKDNMLLYLKK